jgi:hypothetical protein
LLQHLEADLFELLDLRSHSRSLATGPLAKAKALTSKLSHENRQIAAPLAHRVGTDADAAQIADAIVAAWQEVDEALTPIIGQRGVAALYRRSLLLTGSVHPWLSNTLEGAQTGMDLGALKSVLVQQSSAAVADAGNHLLQTFYDLLATLIGASLAARLLRSVWAPTPSGPPAQDTAQ